MHYLIGRIIEMKQKTTDLRLEYPRPDLVRDEWLSLNGEWEFMRDDARNGRSLKYYEGKRFERKILVPYCPESTLSGIGETDYILGVWYRRDITVPREWAKRRIVLHFGAVDNEAWVYLNGKEVGHHVGGYTPFAVEITDALTEGVNSLYVYAEDDARDRTIPAGKQSEAFASHGPFYTRTTGIWQSVWLEPLPKGYVKNVAVTTTIAPCVATVRVRTVSAMGEKLSIVCTYEGKEVGRAEATVNCEETAVSIPLSETHLWECGCGRLYDILLSLSGGDTVKSYFGLREIALDKGGMYLNGKRVFLRMVLDQGFYPDGIYTAPNDARLEQDILDGMALGFNGARMHEKIFEPRYLYHADRHGYLVFGEFPNWGIDIHHYDAVANILPAWIEAIERDRSHPSLIMWCPFNETWDSPVGRQCNAVLKDIYLVTRAIDPSRPCIDTSGNYHVVPDIYDIHNYEQNVDYFSQHFASLAEGVLLGGVEGQGRQKYDPRLPVFVSEYGGIQWDVEKDITSWGYGESVKSEEEFIARYKGLTDVLLDNPYIMGFCYTQIYDVEQEKNGLMTYDRKMKFDPAIFHAINTRKAKIEE